MTSSSVRSGNASDDYQVESGLLDAQTFEDQLADNFDYLTAKSAKTRQQAYESIRKTLTERYMVEFVFNRKITILDTLSKCIKRGQGQDLGNAASLVAIVCATLGQSPETDPIFSELNSHLLSRLADTATIAEVRTKCARSVSICTYIIGMGGYLEPVMSRLYAIFSESCAKGDSTMPNPSEKIAKLHSACLQAWTLLLTAVQNSSPDLAISLVDAYMDKITELLDSPHLDLKISAGETIVVMFEIIKSQNEDLTAEDIGDVCDKIREIVSDTQKSRGKRDLREQRSNFREILAAIEEEDMATMTIKFGRERLSLESWSRRRLYDSFCELFGTGFNHHLAENEIIRDIFNLGPVIVQLDLPRVKRSDNVSKSKTTFCDVIHQQLLSHLHHPAVLYQQTNSDNIMQY